MAWCLFGTKPLSESMMNHCQWYPWEQISVIYNNYLERKLIWKCSLQNSSHFVSASMSLGLNMSFYMMPLRSKAWSCPLTCPSHPELKWLSWTHTFPGSYPWCGLGKMSPLSVPRRVPGISPNVLGQTRLFIVTLPGSFCSIQDKTEGSQVLNLLRFLCVTSNCNWDTLLSFVQGSQGSLSILKCHLTSIGITMLMVRRVLRLSYL